MTNIKSIVASRDSSGLTSKRIEEIIGAYGSWILEYVEKPYCFNPYIISFMPKLASVRSDQQMRDEISRVYRRFSRECLRYPNSEGNRDFRPRLLAGPDWPVWKKNKKSPKGTLPWEGKHWAGILLVPPKTRLKSDVKAHFEVAKKDAYCFRGSILSRIHIEPIDANPAYVTDYMLKAIRHRQCTFDDLIVFPLSVSEQ